MNARRRKYWTFIILFVSESCHYYGKRLIFSHMVSLRGHNKFKFFSPSPCTSIAVVRVMILAATTTNTTTIIITATHWQNRQRAPVNKFSWPSRRGNLPATAVKTLLREKQYVQRKWSKVMIVERGEESKAETKREMICDNIIISIDCGATNRKFLILPGRNERMGMSTTAVIITTP